MHKIYAMLIAMIISVTYGQVTYPGNIYVNTTGSDTLGHSLFIQSFGLNNKEGGHVVAIGNYSCNLQFSRLANSHGPLAPHSAIIGGQNNSISSDGNYSAILAGIGNITKGYASFIIAGYQNKINHVDGDFSGILTGVDNYISKQKVLIAQGDSNYVTGRNNIVFGSNDTISGNYNFIAGTKITSSIDSTFYSSYRYHIIGNGGAAFIKIVKVGSYGAIILAPADTFYFTKDTL